MEKEQVKEELRRRYCYIATHAEELLAPSVELTKLRKKGVLKNDKEIYSIKVGKLPYDLLIDLESFLLSDIPMQESNLYKSWTLKKEEDSYKKMIEQGKELIKKHNDAMYSSYLEITLDAWLVLLNVRQFIAGQKTDRENSVEKLHALDEYFKIARYKNDGHVWHSGYLLKYMDVSNAFTDIITRPHEATYSRLEGDNGLESSKMVLFLTSKSNHNPENDSVLTEKEKQDIYLKYHDELPWDLQAKCAIEDQAIPTLIELGMTRPDHTFPCGNTFYIKEEDIFVNLNERQYRYYMLCPHCGYMVHIPSKELPDTIRKRIEDRCYNDPKLFRKKCLYSELLSLEEDPLVRRRLNRK